LESRFVLLVVDDNELIKESLAFALSDHCGLELVFASQTCDAIGAIDKLVPSAALIDLNLKGETSQTLIEHLLRHDVPVRLMTGSENQPDWARTIPVFKKPFDIFDIEAWLDDCRAKA
jgi:DNA-binding NtrC family response regulator